MELLLKELLAAGKDPAVINALAALAMLAPSPEGPVLSGVLRLYAAFLAAGLKAEQIDLIVAKYSAEAQQIAFDWE